MASLAGVMIVVRNATIGTVIAAIALVSIWISCQCSGEKKREWKAKASSSSFFRLFAFDAGAPGSAAVVCGFLCGEHNPVCFFSVYGDCYGRCSDCFHLFVPPADVTLVEPSRKRGRVESSREREKMLATFEDLWASGKSLSQSLGSLSASQPLLVMPPIAFPAPVPSAVPVAVSACGAHSLLQPSRISCCSLNARLGIGRLLCCPCWARPRPPGVPGPVACLAPVPGPHLPPVPGPRLLLAFHLLPVRCLCVCRLTGVGEFPLLVIVAAVVGFFPFSFES